MVNATKEQMPDIPMFAMHRRTFHLIIFITFIISFIFLYRCVRHVYVLLDTYYHLWLNIKSIYV